MPQGKEICFEIREIVHHYCVELNKSALDIHKLIFNSDNNKCTLTYLVALCARLQDVNFANSYLSRIKPKKTGRPYSLDYMERNLIFQHILSEKHLRVNSMYQNYCRMFYPDNNIHGRLSLSTFKRTLKRSGLTRKVMSRVNIQQNPAEGVQFLESIEHINPLFIIDVDETKNNPESFFQKHGYSPEGEECKKDQIVINGTAYCTIAAVSPIGFLAWQIFEGNVTQEEFAGFINESLAPHIRPEHVCVLDNATIHHAPESRIALEMVFNGNYFYSARYSPHLKPIEPCFALVKNWIRNHEDAAVQDPIGTINAAFHLFSVGGARNVSIRGHWNGYFSNHATFLEQLNV